MSGLFSVNLATFATVAAKAGSGIGSALAGVAKVGLPAVMNNLIDNVRTPGVEFFDDPGSYIPEASLWDKMKWDISLAIKSGIMVMHRNGGPIEKDDRKKVMDAMQLYLSEFLETVNASRDASKRANGLSDSHTQKETIEKIIKNIKKAFELANGDANELIKILEKNKKKQYVVDYTDFEGDSVSTIGDYTAKDTANVKEMVISNSKNSNVRVRKK